MSPCPEFSVVVPLYNKAPFIHAALTSALADRTHVREFIVDEDGSTDAGAKFVAGFADPRVRLVRQANGGVSRARNRGVELARFEWIAFLDADDYWKPGYVRTLAALASRYPDCAMLGTFYELVGDDGARWSPKGQWGLEKEETVRIDDFHGAMANGHLCFTGSIALRRSLMLAQSLKFPEGEQLGEDLDVFFRAAEHTSMGFSTRALSVYRDAAHAGRLSHGRLDEMIPPFIRRMESRLEAGQIPGPKRAGVEQYLATHYEHLVLQAIDAGRRRPALPLLLHPLLRARLARWCGLVAFCLLPVGWGVRIREWRKVVA